MFKLRDYQQNATINAISHIQNGINPCLMLPTGSGKTVVIAELVKKLLQEDSQHSILILTHTKELVAQNAKTINAFCGDVGVFCAGLGRKEKNNKVVVATAQSWIGLLNFDKKTNLIESDLSSSAPINSDPALIRSIIIVDEMHRVPAMKTPSQYKKLLCGENKRIIGLSATPYRDNNKLAFGDGCFFDVCDFKVGVAGLIENKFLTPLLVFEGADFETEKVSIKSTGDFDQSEMEEEMAKTLPFQVAAILKASKEHNSILIFAPSRGYCYRLQKQIESHQGSGIVNDAAVIDSETPPNVRDGLINDFKSGKRQILINCMVLTTGFDHPALDCLILLRATTSQSLYVQMLGRGMRIADGKEYCKVIDFGSNAQRFGSIEDCEDLDNLKKTKERHNKRAWACLKCSFINPISKGVCVNCKHCKECKERVDLHKHRCKHVECTDCGKLYKISDGYCKTCYFKCCDVVQKNSNLNCADCNNPLLEKVEIKKKKENLFVGLKEKYVNGETVKITNVKYKQRIATNGKDQLVVMFDSQKYATITMFLTAGNYYSKLCWSEIMRIKLDKSVLPFSFPSYSADMQCILEEEVFVPGRLALSAEFDGQFYKNFKFFYGE